MASSSARQLADLALTWSNLTGDADLSIIDSDLASDRDLETAVMMSLFLDRRGEDDDKPPSGDPNDRRGWWGDQFAAIRGDKYGSRLWLLDRGVRSNENLLRAKEYASEALAWMIQDRVVASVEVTVEPLKTPSGFVIGVGLQRPGRDPVSFRFAHTWDHLQEDL